MNERESPADTPTSEPVEFVDADDPERGVLAFLNDVMEKGAEEAIREDWRKAQYAKADAEDRGEV